MSYNHTRGLELDIFFVGWDTTARKFLPIVVHINFMNVPHAYE